MTLERSNGSIICTLLVSSRGPQTPFELFYCFNKMRLNNKSADLSDVARVPMEYISQSTSSSNLGLEKEDVQAFEEFCDLRISEQSVAIIGGLLFIITSYVYAMSLIHPRSWHFLVGLVCVVHLVRNPVGLLMIFCKYSLKQKNPSVFFQSLAPWLNFIMNCLAVFSSLTLGLFLLARILNGRCQSLDQLHMWSCNSEYDSHALPQEIVLCLMFLPVMLSTTFKAVRTQFIFLSWLICIFFIALAIIIGDAYQSLPALIIYTPLSATVLYEIHRQNVVQFLVLKKQKMLLEANKRLSEEAQNELRFMIANMAHDLKTVSPL